jgi:hypothetical protein
VRRKSAVIFTSSQHNKSSQLVVCCLCIDLT